MLAFACKGDDAVLVHAGVAHENVTRACTMQCSDLISCRSTVASSAVLCCNRCHGSRFWLLAQCLAHKQATYKVSEHKQLLMG